MVRTLIRDQKTLELGLKTAITKAFRAQTQLPDSPFNTWYSEVCPSWVLVNSENN